MRLSPRVSVWMHVLSALLSFVVCVRACARARVRSRTDLCSRTRVLKQISALEQNARVLEQFLLF